MFLAQRMRFHTTVPQRLICEKNRSGVAQRWVRVLTSNTLKLFDLSTIHQLRQVREGYTSRSGTVAISASVPITALEMVRSKGSIHSGAAESRNRQAPLQNVSYAGTVRFSKSKFIETGRVCVATYGFSLLQINGFFVPPLT